MVLIDSGLPFAHLVVERFEYSPLNGACSDWTLVQLLAGLGDESSAPSVAHLVIEAAAGQRFATAAETHATERRLRADGATGFEVLWSATFAVPLDVVDAGAAFTLLAGDRQPVAVTLPAPVRHVDLSPVLSLRAHRPARQRAIRPRQIAAVATSVAVTATSVPATALATQATTPTTTPAATATTPTPATTPPPATTPTPATIPVPATNPAPTAAPANTPT